MSRHFAYRTYETYRGDIVTGSVECRITFNYTPGSAPYFNPMTGEGDPGSGPEYGFLGVDVETFDRGVAKWERDPDGRLDEFARSYIEDGDNDCELAEIVADDLTPDPDYLRDLQLEDR